MPSDDGLVVGMALVGESPRAPEQREDVAGRPGEVGHVGEPVQQPVHAGGDGGERTAHRVAGRRLKELVGVEREDEVGAGLREDLTGQGGGHLLLEVAGSLAVDEHERQCRR